MPIDDNMMSHAVQLAQMAKTELGLNSSEVDMWLAEPPLDTHSVSPTIYMAAAASSNAAPFPATGTNKAAQILGVCEYVTDQEAVIRPDLDGQMYMSFYKHQFVDFIFNPDGTERTDTVVRVLQPPRHGVLATTGYDRGTRYWYNYVVDSNPRPEGDDDKFYSGADSFILEISAGGVTVQIHYTLGIEVGAPQSFIAENGERVGTTAGDKYCPNGEVWKISALTPSVSGSDDLAAWQRTTEISFLLASASQSLSGFSALAGTAVGNTVGEGSNARITLDPTAAGHGWYLDPTPLDDTDDFLPTADPNVWKARPGSAADGHIDMLSVLLHEYGHVLGLEHSTDVRDFMAARRKQASAAAQV